MAERIDNFKGNIHQLTDQDVSKGGKNSVEARRKKKQAREQLKLLMELSVKDKLDKKTLKNLDIPEDEQNNQMLMLVKMFCEVKDKGNVYAFNSLMNLLEDNTKENREKETPKIEINVVDNSSLEKELFERRDK